MKTEIHSLTAEDIKKFSEDLQRVPKRSEEAQEVYDTLFNYFSHMILNSNFVNVVRCMDCKYNYGIANNCEYAKDDIVCCYWESDGLHSDDFCSKGERKETE